MIVWYAALSLMSANLGANMLANGLEKGEGRIAVVGAGLFFLAGIWAGLAMSQP